MPGLRSQQQARLAARAPGDRRRQLGHAILDLVAVGISIGIVSITAG